MLVLATASEVVVSSLIYSAPDVTRHPLKPVVLEPASCYLWPPYVIGQAIYIFILSFVLLLLLSSFFPHLISAVGDWMSAILPRMAWP